MRLHRLRLVNFRQHADTEIALGQGITAIIGPNGTGKTTLLEAIAWAFYGNPAARGSRETIRWNRAPARSPVRVEVDFALGAHEFRVVRSMYNAELYQDRFDTPIVTSHQEVSARIERTLGMTRQEFFNTYFTGQKELAVMAAMGPTDRAKFLSRVLGYEKLKLAQDRVRSRRSELRAELAGSERGLADEHELNAALEAVRSQRDDATQTLDRTRVTYTGAKATLDAEGPAWTAAVKRRESSVALDSDRRVAERDVIEARREFVRLDRDLAEALAARTQLDKLAEPLARVTPLREELERLEDEARTAGERRSLVGQRQELKGQEQREGEHLEALGNVAGALKDAQRTLERSRKATEGAERSEQEARTGWVRDRQDAQTKRLSLRDQYLDLKTNRDSVVAAGPEGMCPVCERPLGEVYTQMVDTLDRQLEEVEVRGKFFKRRLEQLEETPDELKAAEAAVHEAANQLEVAVQAVAHCEDRVKDAANHRSEGDRLRARHAQIDASIAKLPDSYDSERHDAVRSELRELDPIVKSAAALEVKASAAQALVGEAETAERLASEKEGLLDQLTRAIVDLGFSEEGYNDARRRHEAAQEAVRDAEISIASLEADLKAAEAAVAMTEMRVREREERAEQIRKLTYQVDLHDELDRSLHELRLELNTQMRPELSERASDFLATLTNGRYHELELNEQYDVLIIEEGHAKQVISGGEEDIANLVLRLAISQMVAERAGQPLSLLVLDEIFGSLDEYRRSSVIELLRGLADRFPQVVLITHIESVRDGVDRVLRVELDQQRGAAVVTEGQTTDVAA